MTLKLPYYCEHKLRMNTSHNKLVYTRWPKK